MIGQTLVAENGVEQVVVVAEAAARAVSLILALGFRCGRSRSAAGQPERWRRVANYRPLRGQLLMGGAPRERAGLHQHRQPAVAISRDRAYRSASAHLPGGALLVRRTAVASGRIVRVHALRTRLALATLNRQGISDDQESVLFDFTWRIYRVRGNSLAMDRAPFAIVAGDMLFV